MGVNFQVASVYDLKDFQKDTFDIVTLLDIVEHVKDHKKMMVEINRVLKSSGLLIISTDVKNSLWLKYERFINATQIFSKDGRAYRLIKKVGVYRKQFKNYHNSHINCLSVDELRQLLAGFEIVGHAVFPLVGVPIRDFFLSFFPKQYRGDHQCIVAKKI